MVKNDSVFFDAPWRRLSWETIMTPEQRERLIHATEGEIKKLIQFLKKDPIFCSLLDFFGKDVEICGDNELNAYISRGLYLAPCGYPKLRCECNDRDIIADCKIGPIDVRRTHRRLIEKRKWFLQRSEGSRLKFAREFSFEETLKELNTLRKLTKCIKLIDPDIYLQGTNGTIRISHGTIACRSDERRDGTKDNDRPFYEVPAAKMLDMIKMCGICGYNTIKIQEIIEQIRL